MKRRSKQEIVNALLAPNPKVDIGGAWFEPIAADDLNSDQLRAYKEDGLARVPKQEIVRRIRSLAMTIDGAEYELHKLEQRLAVLVYAHGRKRPAKLEHEMKKVLRP